MSTIRGRAVKVGGVATQDGAAPRVDQSQLTRPAFTWTAGRSVPTAGKGGGSLTPGAAGLLDTSQIAFWRLFWVALAAAYVIGFHITLGRTRIGIGPAGR